MRPIENGISHLIDATLALSAMVVYSLFGISGSGIIRFRVQNVPM